MPDSQALLSLRQQRLLLEIEYATEREAYRRQTEAIGLQRKVKRGDAWYPIRGGVTYYNSLNQLVMEIYRTQDTDIEHNFEYGRPVCFFRMTENGQGETKINYFKQTCMVNYADGNRMVVIVGDTATATEVQHGEHIGVQLFFDETTYRLMFEALDRVMNARDNRLAYLRNLFYSRTPASAFSFSTVRLPWLNPTQEKAVNNVLRAKDVMVVHGPPGTGKTTTLVEAINETLRRESQVLVCAQSNMAVDWISEQLTDRGIHVLRIGNPTRVNDKMLSFTYERRFESHPDYPDLWAVRCAIRKLRKQRPKKHNYHQAMDRLQSRATELELRIQSQLFNEAHVIASTLAGAANRLLDGQHYSTLFIDEAAQALEAACWIAIRKANRVIFAGDHCQLPPTVKSLAALKGGLAKTLMERIVENKPEVVAMLRVQYRMNEQIMRFSSDYFYGGKVESAPQIKYRGILDYDHPMTWIDTSDMDSQEEFIGESFGRINREEAALTVSTLESYFKKIGRQRILDEHIDVGIISPYRAQVQLLRRLVGQHAFFKPYRHLISINTVDGFQGQERDIIIISLVRSNKEGQIGFLRDLRRMNVAITRARMKLIIIGDSSTMGHNPFYRQLYQYVESASSSE